MNVFITGAGSGLGEGLSRRYAVPGATIGLCDRRADLLEAFPAEHLAHPRNMLEPDKIIIVRNFAFLKRRSRNAKRTGRWLGLAEHMDTM